MRYQRFVLFTTVIAWTSFFNLALVFAQSAEKTERQLVLKAKSPAVERLEYRLLPSEAQQERGNAVPVLLRLPHEQTLFVNKFYNKLGEYAELSTNDPKLGEVSFDSFARQIIRAGNMSFADWEYPLDSKQPFMILLPDAQAQRQWVARGMTVWIKQQLAKGETSAALSGIRAQISCARHISQTPFVVCNLVGVAIAQTGLENLELAIQNEKTPNLYWSLAALPITLVDLGPMVRWENHALLQSLPTIPDPLPAIGDSQWQTIADNFIQVMNEMYEVRYTEAEASELMANIDRLATAMLQQEKGFSKEQLAKTSVQERIMRWILVQHSRLTAATEAMLQLPIEKAIQQKSLLDAEHAAIMKETKAKASPFAEFQTNGVLACYRFGRHVRILQTLEAIRDYVATHGGKLPETLSQLDLEAPNDPFTNKPFLYTQDGEQASLKWDEIPNGTHPVREYVLRFK